MPALPAQAAHQETVQGSSRIPLRAGQIPAGDGLRLLVAALPAQSGSVQGRTPTRSPTDADGNRTAAAKGGTRLRTTTWDINGSLATIGTEYGPTGALAAEYQYNPLQQIQAQTTSSGTFFHHPDQLGSVTDVTDKNGAAQRHYSYAAFGEATTTDAAENPPVNPFTYAGAYTEPATSAAGYYLRARNYDPTTGRLTSTNPSTPSVSNPYVSAYAYADNTPTLSDAGGPQRRARRLVR
jgi:RHS repeat-associated protein